MSDLFYISQEIIPSSNTTTQTVFQKVERIIADVDLSESDSDPSDQEDLPSNYADELEIADEFDCENDQYSPIQNNPNEFVDKDPSYFDYPIQIDSKYPVEYLGIVFSLLPEQIIIQSTVIHAPLDLKSIICNSERKVIGRICETFGPVSNPFYVITKNPSSAIAGEEGESVEVGTKVFYSPSFSHIVAMTELSKRRGCDASNQFDQELDESEMECSDDEQERAKKTQRKKRSYREKTKEEDKLVYGEEDGEILIEEEEEENNYELTLKERANLDVQTNISLHY